MSDTHRDEGAAEIVEHDAVIVCIERNDIYKLQPKNGNY